MNALVWIALGAWIVTIAWAIVELSAERITRARQGSTAPLWPHQLETVTETALRAMLVEALRTRNTGLQHRSP